MWRALYLRIGEEESKRERERERDPSTSFSHSGSSGGREHARSTKHDDGDDQSGAERGGRQKKVTGVSRAGNVHASLNLSMGLFGDGREWDEALFPKSDLDLHQHRSPLRVIDNYMTCSMRHYSGSFEFGAASLLCCKTSEQTTKQPTSSKVQLQS